MATNIKDISKKINDEIYMSLQEILLPKLIEKTPLDTGETANLWAIKKGTNLGEFTIYNKSGNIITYLTEGTQPHIIKPKNKKMLKFELVDKETKVPIKPQFKNPADNKAFAKNNSIFFRNKAGVTVLGFSKEGSKYYCFAKQIKHPGFEGRAFIREVLDDQQMWKEIFADVKKHI